jgi:hypothetical protein
MTTVVYYLPRRYISTTVEGRRYREVKRETMTDGFWDKNKKLRIGRIIV